ncbi:MAG: hypothetical protein WDO15_01620 [Bacteroidota bacterium]
MYAGQIIRKYVPRTDAVASVGRQIQQAQSQSYAGAGRIAFNRILEGDAGNAAIHTQTQPLLPGEVVEPGEKLLYKFLLPYEPLQFSSRENKRDDVDGSLRECIDC